MGLSLFAKAPKALKLKEIKVDKTGPQYVHIDASGNGFFCAINHHLMFIRII
jgi:hypothetical protein